jgi:hypothetical protein
MQAVAAMAEVWRAPLVGTGQTSVIEPLRGQPGLVQEVTDGREVSDLGGQNAGSGSRIEQGMEVGPEVRREVVGAREIGQG